MSNLFDINGHLSHWAVDSLKAGTLSEAEQMRAISHIADCLDCADTYADSFSSNELLEVPSGFAEQIKDRLYPEKECTKQFFFYSLRVAIAVCASLVIVFSGILDYAAKTDNISRNSKPPDLEFVNSISLNLQDFSQNLLNLEVLKYENEKK